MSSGNDGVLTLTIKMKVSPEPDSEEKINKLNGEIQRCIELFNKKNH